MPEVGVRQLRDQLSRYLNSVRDGTAITVTDHGRAVARLVPIDQPRLLDRLIEEGVVTPSKTRKRKLPEKRVRPSQPVTPFVDDQRR